MSAPPTATTGAVTRKRANAMMQGLAVATTGTAHASAATSMPGPSTTMPASLALTQNLPLTRQAKLARLGPTAGATTGLGNGSNMAFAPTGPAANVNGAMTMSPAV